MIGNHAVRSTAAAMALLLAATLMTACNSTSGSGKALPSDGAMTPSPSHEMMSPSPDVMKGK